MKWNDTVTLIGSATAGIAALIVIFGTFLGWWNSGLGRRYYWMRKYRSLFPGMRVKYIESIFGEPTYKGRLRDSQDFVQRDSQEITERVWKLGQDGYLLCWSRQGQVTSYSLTSQSRLFRPRVAVGAVSGGKPRAHIRLGRTKYQKLGDSDTPVRIAAFRSGASFNHSEYYEIHNFGQPSKFPMWAVGTASTGRCRSRESGFPGFPNFATYAQPRLSRDQIKQLSESDQKHLELWRRRARIDTVMIGYEIPSVDFPARVAPGRGRIYEA